ncbi:MAG: hypothetical protein D3916_17380 [Candidatus Electrothrix sp. MAN1_4]|nr:hypothetical protein [Candidatus Electrothrix sp. MAN1_4]
METCETRHKAHRSFFQHSLNPPGTPSTPSTFGMFGTIWVLAVLLSLLFTGSALAGSLQLQAAFDNETVYAKQPSPHYLEVLVTASQQPNTLHKRLPLNLALVIDTSGSMRDENKPTWYA